MTCIRFNQIYITYDAGELRMINYYSDMSAQNNKIKRIAIIAGTHGNEITGIQLMKVLQKEQAMLEKKYSLKIKLYYGNPKAIEIGKRFCDRDLNRAFSPEILSLDKRSAYEVARAQELNELIGPKENPQTDLVIDLHTTAANMGFTLGVWDINKTTKYLIKKIAKQNPNVNILHIPTISRIQANSVPSLGKFGLGIEIGPIMPGKSSAVACELMQKSLLQILNGVKAFNERGMIADLCDPTVYSFKEKVFYPIDSKGAICAEFHPGILGSDYKEISPGTPIFISHDGKTKFYCNKLVLATFIGEPAYRTKNLAIITLDKKPLSQVFNIKQEDDFNFASIDLYAAQVGETEESMKQK